MISKLFKNVYANVVVKLCRKSNNKRKIVQPIRFLLQIKVTNLYNSLNEKQNYRITVLGDNALENINNIRT